MEFIRKQWKQLKIDEEAMKAIEINENHQETKSDYVRSEKPVLCMKINE